MKSILKFANSADETIVTSDLLGIGQQVQKLSAAVKETQPASLIGIVGDYGSGKSVMIEIYKKGLGKGIKWVHVDAWKYPERKDLWEGFVIDFIKQIDPKKADTIVKKIEGRSKEKKKNAIKGVWGLIPWIGKLNSVVVDFIEESPAIRVFEIQAIFKELIEAVDEEIYIVVEDADRSGEAGLFFIETLSQFSKTLNTKEVFKILIPISERSFLANKDSYVKALDYVSFFDKQSRELSSFVDGIFCEDLTSDLVKRDHIIETLQRLADKYSLTVRDLKLIIRNSELQYQSLRSKGLDPDPRVVLLIESSRFIPQEGASKDSDSVYGHIRRNRFIEPNLNRGYLTPLFFAIALNRTVAEITDSMNVNPNQDPVFRNAIKFIDHTEVFTPNTSIPFHRDGTYCMAEYYLD